MKPRLLLRLSLLLLLLAACAPRAVPTEAPAATQAVSANPPAEPVTVTPAVSSPAAATALPIATSRGPELEATDPSTVQMASGGLQFVEFFEFWWTTCQIMAPMVHGLEATYFGRIKFSYLEISNPENEEFLRYLDYRVRPSFYLLDADGNILHTWVGQQTQAQFEEVFAQYVP